MFKIQIKVDEDLKRFLDPATIQKATASALNKVMNQAKTAAVNAVTDRWNIKKSDLTTTGTGKARLKITRATWESQVVTLNISGRPLSLSLFAPRQVIGATVRSRLGNAIKTGKITGRMKKAGPVPQGVLVQLLKGQTTYLHKSFLASVRAGNAGNHIGVFNRMGKSRLPILEKRLISVPSMFAKGNIIQEVEKVVNEKFDGIFRHELDYYLKRG
ncbi:MAG: phage tail protein [Geobacteraceae bacterium]|nr:phage tail protein [Geobacteraceae bacterium]